ncbi:MAG: hypothetical protein CMP33_06760 [Rickettsiales bacterium]|nr:hypothetical protein [Rickettsiales bacterium]
MSIFGFFTYEFIKIYSFCVIIYVLLSILISFSIINQTNYLINIIMNFLFKIIEPILNLIRKFIPNFGNVDITPVLLLIFLKTLQFSILKYSL